MSEGKFRFVVYGSYVLAVALVSYLLLTSIASSASKAILKIYPPRMLDAELPESMKKNLKIVCIGGHEYYFAQWDEPKNSVTIFAPKFDYASDLAKPVRCEGEKINISDHP